MYIYLIWLRKICRYATYLNLWINLLTSWWRIINLTFFKMSWWFLVYEEWAISVSAIPWQEQITICRKYDVALDQYAESDFNSGSSLKQCPKKDIYCSTQKHYLDLDLTSLSFLLYITYPVPGILDPPNITILSFTIEAECPAVGGGWSLDILVTKYHLLASGL